MLTFQIVSILTSLHINPYGDPEIRETALLSLITWEPNAAVWNRLAHSTWREPNDNIARFVSSVIASASVVVGDEPTEQLVSILQISKNVFFSFYYISSFFYELM